MNKQYYMVNWVNGMKVKKQHFIQQQQAFTQQVMNAAAAGVTEIDYGLVLPVPGEPPSCKISVDLEPTRTLHVKVFGCRAITPGGGLIHITGEHEQPVHFSIGMPEQSGDEPEQESRFMLAISTDPFTPVPAGEADPAEVPARHPYVRPDYRLSLLPLEQAAHTAAGRQPMGRFHLSIAEVRVTGGRAFLVEDYIPPCRAVYSFPLLVDAHTLFYNQLLKLESLCLQIIQKILLKDQQYLLAHIVRYLSENILSYLNSVMYRFNWQIRYEPPVAMIESIAGLGRIIRNSIDTRQGTGKEELINYFVEWCDLNQAQFEKVVSEVVDLVYIHTAIRPSVDSCSRFLREIVNLYTKLSELDYIGRKTEKDIFVKESAFREKNQAKNKISFWAKSG